MRRQGACPYLRNWKRALAERSALLARPAAVALQQMEVVRRGGTLPLY
jgi:hypothetical protein